MTFLIILPIHFNTRADRLVQLCLIGVHVKLKEFVTPHRFDCWLIYTKHEAGALSNMFLSVSKLQSESQQ